MEQTRGESGVLGRLLQAIHKFLADRARKPVLIGSGLLFLLAGCQGEPGSGNWKIVIPEVAYFSDKPGEVVGPLTVQVLSPPVQDQPGRNGFRDPEEGWTVTFNLREDDIRDQDKAPRILTSEDPTLDVGNDREVNVTTDVNGFARVWVELPKAIGNWRVRAHMKDPLEEHRISFQVTSGVKILKTNLEDSTGKKVRVAVQLFEIGDDGEPRWGVPEIGEDGRPTDRLRSVQFRVTPASADRGARLGKDRLVDRVRVNREGVATVSLDLGTRTGVYSVAAEPWRTSASEPVLPVVILNGIAIDWSLAVIEILGGVFLFLIGLRLLGGGLVNLLGPAVALPVTSPTRSRVRGYAVGFAAGTLFQSATGPISRLISFANGGLLTASGVVGVILGANLGRTILPQILAFPMAHVAVLLLGLGLLGTFLPRRLGLRSSGSALIGAGLLFLGFWLLQEGVVILEYSQTFKAWLMSGNYLESLSVTKMVGAFMTVTAASTLVGMITRSSSLPVAVAIVLGSASLIPPAMALPIVLGANLGPALSLVAVWLGRRLEARRIGMEGLFFHVIGAVWLTALSLITLAGIPVMLYVAEWLTPGILFYPDPEHVGHHIAMLHTIYNLLNGLLCMALSGPILGLVERLIRRDPVREEIKPYSLDPNLIEVPALALLQVSKEVTYLTELCRKTIAESFDAFRYRDLKLAEQTSRREASIDSVHRDVSHYLLRVAENNLARRESSRLAVLQAANGNLARIGTLGERLRDLTTREIDEDVELPEDATRDLNDVYDLVMNQFENILNLLERPGGPNEENAVKVAEKLTRLGTRAEQAWLEKLRLWEKNRNGPLAPIVGSGPAPGNPGENREPSPITPTILYRDALDALFKVAEHLSHIAERMRVLTR